MAKKVLKFDPKIAFENLTKGEQDIIARFLDRWASVMTGKERTALLKRYPKAAAWCAGQMARRPQDARYRKFRERVADMTPAERKGLGLPEVGPRFEPKRTEAEEVAAEERRAKRWSDRDIAQANAGRAREIADEAARNGRWKERDAARAAEARAGELAREADRNKRYDAREAGVRAGRQVQEIEGELAREKRWGAREERASLHKVTLEIGREQLRYARWDVREAEKYGTPNEQRQLARLKGSDYRLSEAERILDEGGWPAMERLNPGCTEKVWNNWLGGERPRWEARLLGGKPPWELTRGDVARSKLSAAQLNEVAYARKDSPVHKRLEELGIRVERPRPVGDYLGAVTKLYGEYYRSKDKEGFFWLNVPGPMATQVPVPRLASWEPKDAVTRSWLKSVGSKPYRPFSEWLEKGAPIAPGRLESKWEKAYGAGGAAVQAAKAARIPAGKAIARALPDIVGLALQTGQLSPETGLAQAYGAYSLQVGAKSVLLGMGLSAAIAGPLSIVIGLAGLFSGRRRRRKAEEERRRREAERRAAGSARALTYQVGYVPRTVGVRYEPSRRRGAARPFRAQYGSRLGLAAATPTRPARI